MADLEKRLPFAAIHSSRRGNFVSTQDLRSQVLDFIAFFNRTMAKPFKCTYLESRSMPDLTQYGLTSAGL